MSLADKLDILEVIARYAYTYDGRDADGFAQLFTEGGIFEVIPAGGSQPELRLETRAAIHAWVVQRHQQVVQGIHDRHYQSGTLFDVLTEEHAQTRTMVLITKVPMIRPRAPCFPVSITTAGTRHSEDGKSYSEPSATITINLICRNN